MYKVLLIDDHKDTLALLGEFLRREGYDAVTADNGKAGFEIAQRGGVDLILLDIVMPDVDGLELCKELIRTPETSKIPVILISARISPEDVRAGFQAGASDYLKKPVNRIELIERVASAFRKLEETKTMVESEKIETFAATVIAANHKLKQPLTLINLSVTSVKRLLQKEPVNKDEILKKLDSIHAAVGDISQTLNQFLKIEKPGLKTYVGDVKMIDLDDESAAT